MRAQAAADAALRLVNELSNRRRLTTFFVNEQSPFYGVQVNYVNVGRGNLTFLNRDLVRLDRIPIVAGRVYDSRLEMDDDFGAGWKLSVAEVIWHRGNSLRYIDASGSVYELQLEGVRIVSRYPHLTGIQGGRRQSGDLVLQTGGFTKRFTNIRGAFYLTMVTDDFGNSVRIDYSGTRITRVSSQNGRYVEIERDPSGRITLMRDDAARIVKYHYDSDGRLFSVVGIGDAQWRYRYDANGHLEAATDPRGIDALTAAYGADGKAAAVRVLYDVTSFSYQSSTATVSNGLQQAATFWHDASGLTTTIQDFEGSTTEVAFDGALKPTSLTFNGTTVAALRYGSGGQVQEVRSFVEGRPHVTRLIHDDTGRPTTVFADDEAIARYTYDRAGRVLSADDTAGVRSYRHFGAARYQIRIGELALEIETNKFGLMRSFSNGHQTVDIFYNEVDQVSDIEYVAYGDLHRVAYTYGASGLRSSGSYLLGEEPEPGTLSLDYDIVGNLTNVSVETPRGALSAQTYVLGVNNQLTRLMNPSRPDLVFEHDFAGRPTRRTLDASDARYEYDALGRIAAAYEQGQKVVEWRYGPMDVDAATEADNHTPWTAVNGPLASAIFGSAESIAYARTRGTPYGPIRFNAGMARFVLSRDIVPSADSVILASLQRRNLPLWSSHHDGVGPGPLAFDKPSNALFLPPEFSSLNCYMCVARITNAGNPSMSINGSFANPVIVPFGGIENINVTGSGRCWGDLYGFNPETNDWQIVETHQGLFIHDFFFGNGASAQFTTPGGQNPNKSTVYIHPAPGLYTVTDWIGCECAYGGMVGDVLGAASRDVWVVEPPPPPVTIRLTFDDGPHVGGSNNTQTVYAALQLNPVQTNIPATFFVQTHVSYRGGSSAGAAVMADALARGHNVMIHTGSDTDHTLHTARVLDPPYAGGANALESDLIRAKSRIAGLPGPVPTYVRPPEGAYNAAVLQSYAATQLEMKLWDVVSGDDQSGASFASISAQLTSGLTAAINGGDTDIVILFHDIHSHTANNLGGSNGYIQLIKDVAENLGRTVVFNKL